MHPFHNDEQVEVVLGRTGAASGFETATALTTSLGASCHRADSTLSQPHEWVRDGGPGAAASGGLCTSAADRVPLHQTDFADRGRRRASMR